MSFGKDPTGLEGQGSFRQLGRALTARPKFAGAGSGGGGGGGNANLYRNKFRPSMIAPDTVRLLRPPRLYDVTYVPLNAEGRPLQEDAEGRPMTATVQQPFVKAREHFYKRTNGTGICSAGALADFRKFRETCLGCDEFWNGRAAATAGGTRGKGAMSMSDNYVLSALHYAQYHEAPQEDKHGKVKMNTYNNTPYTEWTPCLKTYNMPCKHCHAIESGRSQMKSKLGHVGHWPLGFGHWNTLLATQDQIGSSCLGCGGPSCVVAEAWVCRNPACGAPVVDLTTSTLQPKEISKMTTGAVVCPYCQHEGYLEEVIECRNCTKPQRATLFDVDISVMRVKQTSGDSETTVLQPSNWSAPRPIDPRFIEIAIPLELDKLYAPTPLDVQAKRFNLPLPAGFVKAEAPAGDGVTADTATRGYAAPVQLYGDK